MVPFGFSRPQRVVTKRPEVADRVTPRVLALPPPTRSVVVVFGDRFACPLVTNRPVRALLEIDRPLAMMASFLPE